MVWKKNQIQCDKVWFTMVYNSVGFKFLNWGINETIEIEHCYIYNERTEAIEKY